MKTAQDFNESLRQQRHELYVLAEKVYDPLEHPIGDLSRQLPEGVDARRRFPRGAGDYDRTVV